MRSHHDMGGLPAGKVDREEHDYAEWERRVDAVAVLLGRKRRLTVDERRRAIETLTPQAYDALSYYERWVIDEDAGGRQAWLRKGQSRLRRVQRNSTPVTKYE